MIRPALLLVLAHQARGFGMAPALFPRRAALSPAIRQSSSSTRRWLGLRASASELSLEKQAASFDAEQAALYSRMADNHRHPQGPWKVMLEAVQGAVADSANPTILDLASGPGEPAATIARAIPGASVIATDISPDMVATAAKVAATLPNMKAEACDMEAISAHSDGSLDVVTCCYGFMFPPNKEKAIEEAFRVLKPGGTLVATTWNNVIMMTMLRDLMTSVLGSPPPPPPMNPLSLAEPGLFEGMLENGGFVGIETSTSTYPFDITADPEFQYKLCTMLVKDKIAELEAEGKARAFFDERVGDYTEVDDRGHRVLVDNTFKLTVARKP